LPEILGHFESAEFCCLLIYLLSCLRQRTDFFMFESICHLLLVD